jgi:ATP-dependent Zn protease
MCNAYHEAGHAVAGRVLGRCIEAVSLIPPGDVPWAVPHAGSYCKFDMWAEGASDNGDWTLTDRPERIAILLAGAVAFVYLCQERGWEVSSLRDGSAHDLQEAESLCGRLEPTEQERKHLFDVQEAVALELIADFWPEVKRVAAALLLQGTLSGDEVHRLIDPTV